MKEKNHIMSEPKVEVVDGGFTIYYPDGRSDFVADHELLLDRGIEPNKPRFRIGDLKTKISSWKQQFSFPEPIRAMLFLKTEEDRYNYIKSLPKYSVNAIVSWFTYIILKGQVLEKCIDLGITMPEDVSSFFNKIEIEVKRTGKVTKEAVSKAVDATISFSIAVSVIGFGVFLLMNPALIPVFMAVASVAEITYWFSKI